MTLTTDAGMQADAVELEAAIALIWREAEMLDRLDYRAWLQLWSQDGLYIVPTEPGTTDYAGVLNIAYDDAAMREARTRRLMSGFSMASAPPARTVRTVSRFVPGPAEPDALALRCAMMVVEYKYGRTRLLAADVDYRIVNQDGLLKIDRKVVTLVNCDDFLHGIGYLL